MKIYIKTFGCRVNQVESQHLAERFSAADCALTEDFEKADVCVLNTCTVTAEADRDVEHLARAIARRNPAARLIITGCYATIHKAKLQKAVPAAEIIANPDKKNIAALVTNERLPEHGFGWEISGHAGHTRAFVKVQDGCTDACRYCLVWKARPVKSSKPAQDALAEIKNLVAAGYPEIVLTGINIGNYLCPQTGKDLPGLLANIFKLDGNFRVRLSSIEPKNISPELIAICQMAGDKFCRHFHIPLQGGTNEVLRAMGRRYDTGFYESRVNLIRENFENAGIYADVIAGYPEETDGDFEKGYAFIKKLKLSGLHVFRFSPRPGTEAAELKCHPLAELKARSKKLRDLDKIMRAEFARSLAGTAHIVTIEESKGGNASGVAGNFQKVLIEGASRMKGLCRVTITKAQDDICFGTGG
ncbi:MAG: MiaB/RimO family radical SAM methylthiotransferase [Elusimicrobiaceae bacterium]